MALETITTAITLLVLICSRKGNKEIARQNLRAELAWQATEVEEADMVEVTLEVEWVAERVFDANL